MDEQEVLNQIKELQKQRTSLKEQDITLVHKITALKDMLFFPNGNLYPFITVDVLYAHIYVGKFIIPKGSTYMVIMK